jgi:hypothetical protein
VNRTTRVRYTILRFLYFNFFSASFCITFLSDGIATLINKQVLSLFLIFCQACLPVYIIIISSSSSIIIAFVFCIPPLYDPNLNMHLLYGTPLHLLIHPNSKELKHFFLPCIIEDFILCVFFVWVFFAVTTKVCCIDLICQHFIPDGNIVMLFFLLRSSPFHLRDILTSCQLHVNLSRHLYAPFPSRSFTLAP